MSLYRYHGAYRAVTRGNFKEYSTLAKASAGRARVIKPRSLPGISYQCKTGHHAIQCVKMNCSCECHGGIK